MTAQDYPVPRKTIEELERLAVFVRRKCGMTADQKIDVFQLLFGNMPPYLKELGLTLVPRSAGNMAEREAYAAPAAKRIFYRPTLLARLKFGDHMAGLIFLHELAHVFLHAGRGGADKAWFTGGNDKIRYIAEEESAEWQATVFALCLKAPEKLAISCESSEEISSRFSIDPEHAKARFEILKRKKPRKLPEIYDAVRVELSGQTGPRHGNANSNVNTESLPERCPECGNAALVAIDANYYCNICKRYGAKFQDGDSVGP